MEGKTDMFDHVRAIRAAIFGICFGVCSSLIDVFVFDSNHFHYGYYGYYYGTVGISIACIVLVLVVLCATWATLKPYVIYGGLHSSVWLVGIAACVILMTPIPHFWPLLPLAIALFISILLFVKMNRILLLLHSGHHFIVGRPMPKQPRFDPSATLGESQQPPMNYQEGYQQQASYQEGGQKFAYTQPQQPQDTHKAAQSQYPKLTQ